MSAINHGLGLHVAVELFEATSDCVFVLDADWRFAYLNNKAATELSENLLGSIIWQSFPFAVGSKFEEVYRRVAAQRESETFEAYYPHPLDRWYEVHAVPYLHVIVVFFRNITQRRAAADALLRRHNELDSVLSSAGVGIMQYTDHHRLVVINDQFCHILGRTRDELDGLPMEAFTHPDDIVGNSKLLAKHRRLQTPFSIRKRYVRPDGEVVWCSVVVSFVQHGEAPATIVVAREIGPEREAEFRARETQALLQTVVDSAQDLIYVKDKEGRFILVNRKMTEDFGIAVGQLGGDLFPNLSARFLAEDRQVMTTGQRLVTEEQIPVQNGIATFHTIKVPWKQDGGIKGVIGVSRDISELVQSEHAVRDSRERFRLAALATGDAIWEWDLESGKVEWSSSAPNLTGERPGISLKWWEERVHPDDREHITRSLHAFIESGSERWEGEYRFLMVDGTYGWVLDRAFLVRDEEGVPVRMIGAMADVTERVEAQSRINRLQAELVQISRVSAMGTMGSTIAHEINQPLAAAANYLLGLQQLLASGRSSCSDLQEGVDQARFHIARAGQIIRSVRAMVEGGQANVRSVKLISCIYETLTLAIPNAAKAGIEIFVDVPPSTEVMADPVQLQQVLFNLVRNSAEALDKVQRKHIRIEARARDDEVIVKVADTGEGLNEESRSELFSAFSSTKVGGLGVGLSVCRTIIEAHGGKIWAEDGKNDGETVFAFTLQPSEAAKVSPVATA